ncbi:MAG: hypothetical protein ACK4VY_00470 [Brevundimonas sp.]
MARAPKVFRYSNGFHAWTVATSSRAKALAAWGMSRDLFKDGLAEEIDDGPDRDAALKAPGEVIKRGLAVDVGEVERVRTPKAKAGPSAKDRARVKALEAELDEMDATQAEETAALEARRAALEREAETLERTQAKARDGLKAKLRTARARLS